MPGISNFVTYKKTKKLLTVFPVKYFQTITFFIETTEYHVVAECLLV